MGGSVNFRHDSNTILFGQINKRLGLIQRVILSMLEGTGLSQFGMGCQLKGEGLIVTQVPVENIKLGQGHGLDQLGNSLNFEEMPGTVDHDSSVGDEGFILNGTDLYFVLVDLLGEGLQGVDVAAVGVDGDGDVWG